MCRVQGVGSVGAVGSVWGVGSVGSVGSVASVGSVGRAGCRVGDADVELLPDNLRLFSGYCLANPGPRFLATLGRSLLFSG